MTEQEWLTSTDPAAMLRSLEDRALAGHYRGASDRKLNLFCCACCTAGGLDGKQYEEHGIGISPNGWAASWACRHEDAHDNSFIGRQGPSFDYVRAALLRCVFGNPWRPRNPVPEWLSQARREWQTPAVVALARSIHDDRLFEDLPILADALEEAGCTDAAILGHLRETVPCKCRLPRPNLPHPVGRCRRCKGTGHVTAPHARGCHVLDLLLGLE